MKKFKINEQEIFANSLHDALEIYKHKVKAKDEVYYEDIDSSSEAKKYAKKFGLEVEGRRAPWGGYEFAFEGSSQDLKKLVQELKKIGIEPTWSSVGDSKVKDKNNVYEMQYTNTAKKYTNIDKFRAPSLAEAMTRINLTAYVEGSRRRDILVKSIKENGIDLNISGRGDVLLKKYNPSAWSTGTLGHHYDDSIVDSKVNDRDYTDEMAITELEGAIIAIKNENYKKAMEMVRNVFTSLKFQVETSRHLR